MCVVGLLRDKNKYLYHANSSFLSFAVFMYIAMPSSSFPTVAPMASRMYASHSEDSPVGIVGPRLNNDNYNGRCATFILAA